jgi:hypothetical protein
MSKKIIILLAFTSFIYLMLYSCGVLFDAPKLEYLTPFVVFLILVITKLDK